MENHKDSYTDVVIRIDQKLKDFMFQNNKDHQEIISSIKDLSNHVNHEIEDIHKELNILQKKELVREVTWKTLAKIGTTILAVSGALFGLIELLIKLGV